MGPSRRLLVVAFASIYLIWGSTYLAIRIGLESMPPLLLIGVRCLAGGSILYAWSRMRGGPAPLRVHWGTALILGPLLFAVGQGGLAWAETRVPSGVAALFLATIPVMMTLMDAFRPGGKPLGLRQFTGLVLGLSGVILLAHPAEILSGRAFDRTGVGVLLLAAFSWSFASVRSRSLALPTDALQAAGMNLLTGGGALLVAGLCMGERAHLLEISARSGLALLYLILFGSIIAVAAYFWLLRVSSPARVSTYAFVNPIVAVLLGWSLGGETLSLRVLSAALVMVAGVALLVIAAPRRSHADGTPEDRSEAEALERGPRLAREGNS